MHKVHEMHIKKCFDTNNDTYLALLQGYLTPIDPGLPRPVTLLFNRPIRGIMPKLNRPAILFDHDDDHYAALIFT